VLFCADRKWSVTWTSAAKPRPAQPEAHFT
jgi:hypothetical protein